MVGPPARSIGASERLEKFTKKHYTLSKENWSVIKPFSVEFGERRGNYLRSDEPPKRSGLPFILLEEWRGICLGNFVLLGMGDPPHFGLRAFFKGMIRKPLIWSDVSSTISAVWRIPGRKIIPLGWVTLPTRDRVSVCTIDYLWDHFE